MAGLETYYGNPASEHAETHLDLSGIGGMLALSRQRHLNFTSVVHFRNEFGSQRIYAVTAPADEKSSGKKQASKTYVGNRLFGENVSYSDLVSAVLRGRKVTSTTLTEEFTWEAYQNKYGDKRTPIPAKDRKSSRSSRRRLLSLKILKNRAAGIRNRIIQRGTRVFLCRPAPTRHRRQSKPVIQCRPGKTRIESGIADLAGAPMQCMVLGILAPGLDQEFVAGRLLVVFRDIVQ